MKKLVTALAFGLFSISNLTSASPTVEQTIEQSVKPLLEGMPIEKVSFSQRLGLYEVITPRGIVYTDKKGSYVLFGATAVDTATKANLTAERMDKLGEFEFGKLPLGDAVKIVHGKGTRKLVTFEDPNCGFCKKLSHELAKIDDVTIFTILYPILSPDSTEKSKAIWCSTDREKTYTEYMMRGTTLPDVKACDSPISRNVTLGQKLRVMGTPAILFEDNTRSPGYMAAEEIETRLDKAAKKK